jgi:hypothetical protein
MIAKNILELPTTRLLAFFKKHYRDRRGRMSYNCFTCGYITEAEYDDFMEKYNIIKNELDSREHVDKKAPEIDNNRLPNWWVRYHEANNKNFVPKGPIEDTYDAIGKQVCKTSKKPFKSKNKYNTVSGLTVNPHTNLEAFTFEEDDSIVDVHVCNLRKVK